MVQPKSHTAFILHGVVAFTLTNNANIKCIVCFAAQALCQQLSQLGSKLAT
jgi:hypothetical protein